MYIKYVIKMVIIVELFHKYPQETIIGKLLMMVQIILQCL